jgi:hypothetical protein
VLISCSGAKSGTGKQKSFKREFARRLNALDSAAALYKGDTIFCCSSSIGHMVGNADMKRSRRNISWIFVFTRDELSQWHEHYNNNVLRSPKKKKYHIIKKSRVPGLFNDMVSVDYEDAFSCCI